MKNNSREEVLTFIVGGIFGAIIGICCGYYLTITSPNFEPCYKKGRIAKLQEKISELER